MSTQQYIAGLGHSNTYKRFKYRIVDEKGGTVSDVRFVPKGWQEGELTFIRDKVYKGVQEIYSTNSFEFVKDAKNIVQTVYETDRHL